MIAIVYIFPAYHTYYHRLPGFAKGELPTTDDLHLSVLHEDIELVAIGSRSIGDHLVLLLGATQKTDRDELLLVGFLGIHRITLWLLNIAINIL